MSGLGSGRRVSTGWAGLSVLVCGAAWNCAKVSPPPRREATALAPPAEAAPAPAIVTSATRPAAIESGVAANARVAAKHNDFTVYWGELRSALLGGDAEAVARLARFPFAVRGEADDDPVRHVERPAFPAILRQLLARDVGLSPEPEPLSQYLKRMNAAPPGAVSGTTARVASLQFALGPDGWRLVGAYLEDSE